MTLILVNICYKCAYIFIEIQEWTRAVTMNCELSLPRLTLSIATDVN